MKLVFGSDLMYFEALRGIMIPFIGTTLGSSCVLLMKKVLSRNIERLLMGAAAGVMTAASIWSLLLPAISQCEARMGQLAFIPPAAGFALGILFLMLIDRLIPQIKTEDCADGSGRTMMMLAVTLHNIPEGMAVGVVYAGLLYGSSDITEAAALTLAVGIAIQNFPEGAIISMPLHASGMSRARSFAFGTLSGIVEPIGAAVTVAAAGLIIPAMPYLLSFAAGAMIYVTVSELIPEIYADGSSEAGTAAYSAGFLLMMILDVALG